MYVQAKIVLIGEATVGKSTIRERYLGIGFRPAYLQTVGADYTIKKQLIENKESLNLQIWDLAGQQGFSSIRDAFYKGTDGVILVFDVTRPKTADKISDWIKEVKRNLNENVPILLVGNKIDLRDSKKESISNEQGMKLAKKFSHSFRTEIDYIESSAKTGENIDEVFSIMAESVINFKEKKGRKKKIETTFETYFNEVSNYVQLFFFKMLEDGPACVSQTSDFFNEELLVKMAIFYSTALGQGASEHTGLFGPFPIPEINDEVNPFASGQSLIYSFKKNDHQFTDERAKGINFCFFVITIEKELLYQFSNDNAINRFFFGNIVQISDVEEITENFLLDLKKNLLNEVFILNNA